jgi:tetratricopeptide (TPR) repeat protein
MIQYKRTLFITLLIIVTILGGCKKYLDEKPDKKLAVISSLDELQGLLDYDPDMSFNDISACEVSADDYYVTSADWSARSETERRMYTWEKDYLFTPGYNDWSDTYYVAYCSNTVLDNISKIDKAQDENRWNDIKGQALYHRAHAYLQALLTWSVAYDEQTANSDLGIPLRLNTDFNTSSNRANVEDSYNQVILDLKEALRLLPITAIHKICPCKPAAYALLARAYLSMRKYDEVGLYADSALQLNNSLMDYNDATIINPSAALPIPRFNIEVLTDGRMTLPSILSSGKAKIDSSLYASYDNNDLRKEIFFKSNNNGTYGFKGSYSKTAALSSSITVDETYLMRAESFARSGKINEAMNDLNTLLIKRWKSGTFFPFSANNITDALNIILHERRKELIMRGLRWMDIKRLNKEGANISLTRIVNGVTYTLPPNDLRFALPIPEDIITLSGIQQNKR